VIGVEEGMMRKSVASKGNALEQIRMGLGAGADDEEGRFDILAVEQIEDAPG